MHPLFKYAAILIASTLANAGITRAGDLCPAPPKPLPGVLSIDPALDDHRIHIESDSADLGVDGKAKLNGRVTVQQNQHAVSADAVDYDSKTGRVTVTGDVQFDDPLVRLTGSNGSFDTDGNASVGNANFSLLNRNGRGSAREITVHPDGRLDFNHVEYTTCPVGVEDWYLKARGIHLDTTQQIGVGHDVRLDFKGVPILYTPYISFPLGDARKSGFLFPTFGTSSTSGFQFSQPYYFNLAPNYDLQLDPGIQTNRGAELGAEFRYLTHASHGDFEGNFLPDDRIEGTDRSFVHLRNVTDFQPNLRLDADVANVSDVNYFQDFAVGSEATSVTYLERRADLVYRYDGLLVRTQLQNFQTIDETIASLDRPYSRVPRIQAVGSWPLANSGFEFGFNGEAVNFLRDDGSFQDCKNQQLQQQLLETPRPDQCAKGVRLDLSPELRYALRGAGYFFEPSAGFRFTQYDLHDQDPGTSSTPSRELPYVHIDSGLIFERAAGSHGQRTQTLEPELVYTYVPYRNQDSLPIFDTGVPDLNLAELFRTNRFVGADRVGDANQLSMGLTTRLFDQSSGAQYLAATVGQTRYFTAPRVALPDEPILNHSASDIVGQLDITAYKHFNLNFDYEWDPEQRQTERSEVSLQYRLDPTHVINVGYRFRRGSLEQWDTSVGWAIAARWNVVGRLVYSTRDRQEIEQVAGFEYKSCCWRLRLIQRRYLSTRAQDGQAAKRDTSIALQLELTGLGSVGVPADAFLERTIRGYSSRNLQQ